MKKLILNIGLIMAVATFGLHGEDANMNNFKEKIQQAACICCIDGGGSKTEMQIIDAQGNLFSFYKNGEVVDVVCGPGCNINTIGADQVRKTFEDLFQGIEFGERRIPIDKIKNQIVIVAGLAGFGSKNNNSMARTILSDLGFLSQNLFVYSDSELLFTSFTPGEILLIGGTGSCCVGKNIDGSKIQCGGLGKTLGDEGSGYAIGLQTIKKVLEVDQGWGEATSLTQIVKNQFGVEDLQDLFMPLQQGIITPDQIAALTPYVFQEAKNEDETAMRIVYNAAQDLGTMLDKIVHKINCDEQTIYLSGGLFKGKEQEWFIRTILQSDSFNKTFDSEKHTVKILGAGNPAVVAVLKLLSLA